MLKIDRIETETPIKQVKVTEEGESPGIVISVTKHNEYDLQEYMKFYDIAFSIGETIDFSNTCCIKKDTLEELISALQEINQELE